MTSCFAGDFLQAVANLARNVSPATKDLMDVVEMDRSQNDMAYLKQSGIPYRFSGKISVNTTGMTKYSFESII